MAADPVPARKDLKAMGVDDTERHLAKVVGNGDTTTAQFFEKILVHAGAKE